MKKEIICTVCPHGCHILVEGEGDSISSINGYGCKRGLTYASTEFSHPVRILTTTVLVDDGNLLPVRSAAPIPKELMLSCMDRIRNTKVTLPVRMHQVIVPNIVGTGVNIIATKDLL
jgi:CxxC motif-containing protein